jgi:hypothetical protein
MVHRVSWCFALCLFASITLADDKAVSDFKSIVARLESHFKMSPLLYDVQTFSKSPTGVIIYVNRFVVGSLQFDVKKTDSIITPLHGTVRMELTNEATGKCEGATTMEEAQQIAHKVECWKDVNDCEALFTYGYADSAWQFRGITSRPSGCALLFNYAAGAPTSGRQTTAINDPWRRLILGP